LFGHQRGRAQMQELFETADPGTPYSEEVRDLPLELQPKLVDVLQEKQFERFGSNRPIHVYIRDIAATNQHLWQMVQDGKFRSDLYCRLNVFPMPLPPLRERREDIPLLAQCYFVHEFAKQQGRVTEIIPDGFLTALENHNWPGNILELQNVIE